jgi:hypothetical protein
MEGIGAKHRLISDSCGNIAPYSDHKTLITQALFRALVKETTMDPVDEQRASRDKLFKMLGEESAEAVNVATEVSGGSARKRLDMMGLSWIKRPTSTYWFWWRKKRD